MKIAFRSGSCELFLDIYDKAEIKRHINIGYKPVVKDGKYQTYGQYDLAYKPVTDLAAMEMIRQVMDEVM